MKHEGEKNSCTPSLISCLNGTCHEKVTIEKLALISFLQNFTFYIFTIPFTESVHFYFGDKAFQYLMLITSLRSIMQMVGSLIFGELSDKIGRKNLSLLHVVVSMIPAIFFGFTQLKFYFIFHVISGFFHISSVVVLSYAIDISTKSNRNLYVSIISGMIPIAAIVGITANYAIRSILDCDIRFGRVAILHLIFSFIIFFYIILKLGKSPIVKSNPKTSKFELVKSLYTISKSEVIKRLIIIFLVSLATEGMNNSLLIYMRYYEHFTVNQETLFVALIPVFTVVGAIVFPNFILPILKLKTTLIISLVLVLVTLNVVGTFPYKIAFFLMAPFIGLPFAIVIILISDSSKLISSENNGLLVGFIQSLHHIALVASSLFTGLLFFKEGIVHSPKCKHGKLVVKKGPKGIQDFFKGIPYIVASVFALAAIVLTIFLKDTNETSDHVASNLEEREINLVNSEEKDITDWKKTVNYNSL